MNADILVRPHDMLFVGPPWSASAGETHRVRSLFPPPPTTFQGAVRTHLLRRAGVSLRDKSAIKAAVGGSDALPAGCSIWGPWVAELVDDAQGRRRGAIRPWFPVPRWCVVADGRIRPLRPAALGLQMRSDDMFRPLEPAANAELLQDGWVRADQLATLLSGKPIPAALCLPLPAGVKIERRPGLAVKKERTAQRGMFYVDEGYRFPGDVGLAATVTWSGLGLSGVDFASGGMTIGARGRVASVGTCPPWERAADELRTRPVSSEGGGDATAAWIYLASPVFVDDPASPTFPGAGGASAISVHVVTPAVGRPLTLGGFRMAEGSPRPLRPFVPPGSGWYVELRGGDRASRRAMLEGWHGRAILGAETERAMGCGVVLIAHVPEGDIV